MARAKKTRRRRASKKQIVPIIYKRGGVTTRHIDMPAEQLSNEVDRLVAVIRTVHTLLKRIRAKHQILEEARYMLMYGPAKTGADLTEAPVEHKVLEIGRLNHLMNTALTTLQRMQSTNEVLDESRFKLRYGQTSRKREAGWNSFKKDRVDTDSIRDPEEREDDDYEPDFDE